MQSKSIVWADLSIDQLISIVSQEPKGKYGAMLLHVAQRALIAQIRMWLKTSQEDACQMGIDLDPDPVKNLVSSQISIELDNSDLRKSAAELEETLLHLEARAAELSKKLTDEPET